MGQAIIRCEYRLHKHGLLCSATAPMHTVDHNKLPSSLRSLQEQQQHSIYLSLFSLHCVFVFFRLIGCVFVCICNLSKRYVVYILQVFFASAKLSDWTTHHGGKKRNDEKILVTAVGAKKNRIRLRTHVLCTVHIWIKIEWKKHTNCGSKVTHLRLHTIEWSLAHIVRKRRVFVFFALRLHTQRHTANGVPLKFIDSAASDAYHSILEAIPTCITPCFLSTSLLPSIIIIPHIHHGWCGLS